MYEVYIYILISIIFESGGGMLYGVAVGFDPLLVFLSTLTINILTVFASIVVADRLLEWKKGLRSWLEKRTARGQRLINKYRIDRHNCRGVCALAHTGSNYWSFIRNSVKTNFILH